LKDEINDINDLLGKYLAGEASENEHKRAEEWIAQSESNLSYFNHLKIIFDRASSIKEMQDFDVDQAWINVKNQLSESKRSKTIFFPQTNIALRIAAVLVITVGLGYFTYQWFSQPIEVKSLASTTEIVKDSLPDGTLTVLNKESSIQYSSSKNERKVILEGEAFFEIKPDDKQFIVEVNGVIIKDIGTAFNVKSVKGSPLVEVYVESGEVSIKTLTSEQFNLLAGEAGIFDIQSQLFSRIEKLDTNKLAYKTGIFNFRNVSLETILNDLNSVYDVKVKVRNKAIDNCRLTVTFKNERIEDVVEIIAASLNLTVSKDGNDFILDGMGCEN
jgi:ferric-dicitrate binding protein FerR (iron transport regulator)